MNPENKLLSSEFHLHFTIHMVLDTSFLHQSLNLKNVKWWGQLSEQSTQHINNKYCLLLLTTIDPIFQSSESDKHCSKYFTGVNLLDLENNIIM